jgi:hypothetical protein
MRRRGLHRYDLQQQQHSGTLGTRGTHGALTQGV